MEDDFIRQVTRYVILNITIEFLQSVERVRTDPLLYSVSSMHSGELLHGVKLLTNFVATP